MGPFAILLPAAGRSTRFGDPKQKKIYNELGGRAVWLRAVEPFVNRDDVAQIVLAIHAEDRELFERRYRPSVAFMNIQVIDGGEERVDSVALMLERVDPACEFVAVHDAARPFPTRELIDAVFQAARDHGSALPGLPVSDTLKRADADGIIRETVPRHGLFGVQTPQAFRRDVLQEAYANRHKLNQAITDDAQLVEAIGQHCRIVPGSPLNLKITTKDDLRIAQALLSVVEREQARPHSVHPFADETNAWDDRPVPRPEDLFS